MKEHKEVSHAVLGAGVLLGLVLAVIIFSLSFDGSLIEWAYKHQSLAAGILAVFAGVITSVTILLQMAQNYNFRIDTYERKLAAAKGTLPLILSGFTEYGKKCFVISAQLCKGEDFQPQLPTLSDSLIDDLKECIEYSDEVNRTRLAGLLKIYQVQRVRLADACIHHQPMGRTAHAADLVAYAAGHFTSTIQLLLAVEGLWGFARSTDDLIVSTEDRIKGFFTLYLPDEDHDNWPTVIDYCESTYKGSRLYELR